MCVHAHVCKLHDVCGGQRTAFGGQVSPSTVGSDDRTQAISFVWQTLFGWPSSLTSSDFSLGKPLAMVMLVLHPFLASWNQAMTQEG